MVKKKRSWKISKKDSISHKIFWMGIGALFLLSFLTVSMFTYPQILGKAVQTISFLKAGSTLAFEVKESGINNVSVTLAKDAKGGKILFTPDVSIPFDGKAYSKLKISVQNLDFSALDFMLKVAETDLNQLNINRDSLYLYVNGKEYPAKLVYIKEGYNYYDVNGITEIGDFVIGEKNKPVPEEVKPAIKIVEQTINEETPVEPEVQQPQSEEKVSFWQKVMNYFKI